MASLKPSGPILVSCAPDMVVQDAAMFQNIDQNIISNPQHRVTLETSIGFLLQVGFSLTQWHQGRSSLCSGLGL